MGIKITILKFALRLNEFIQVVLIFFNPKLPRKVNYCSFDLYVGCTHAPRYCMLVSLSASAIIG